MKDKIVTFSTAKLAKEKGFFFRCKDYYNTENPLSIHGNNPPLFQHGIFSQSTEIGQLYEEKNEENGFLKYQIDTFVEAPTQSLLQKWLREKHHLHINFSTTIEGKWQYVVIELKFGVGFIGMMSMKDEPEFETYEKALEEGLQEALKLISDDKQREK